LDQQALDMTETPERLAAATEELVRANDAAPAWGDGEVLLELAAACHRIGDTNRAAVFAAKADQVASKPWYYFNRHARFEYARANYEQALADQRAAVKQADDSPLAWANLGLIMLRLDKNAEALDCLRTSLRRHPTAYGYDGLGEYYMNVTNWQGAATNFEAAARQNPARYDLPGKAGLAYLHLANQTKAEPLLTRAVDMVGSRLTRTEDVQAEANRGLYQAALGHVEEASGSLLSLQRRFPHLRVVRDNIVAAADMLDLRGLHAGAQQLRRALEPPSQQ
jgi:tetratricopeptide (TPR) repeat protein